MQSIVIKQPHKKSLKRHHEKYKPNEACALLFGTTEGEKTQVQEIYLADNIKKSPVNFSISNEELLEAYKESERMGYEVVGIFHSHPSSGAYPSSTDKKFMKINPVIWIIFSGINDELRGYVLNSQYDIVEIDIFEE